MNSPPSDIAGAHRPKPGAPPQSKQIQFVLVVDTRRNLFQYRRMRNETDYVAAKFGRRRSSLDEAFRAALRAVPAFAGIETLETRGLELRRVWVRFFPHMAAIFAESSLAI